MIYHSETDLALTKRQVLMISESSLAIHIKYPVLSFAIGESDPIPENCHSASF